MADPLDLLLELRNACVEGQPLSAAVAQWMAGAIDRSLDGARLDECLGLAGAGVRSIARQHAQLMRDRHLVAAAHSVTLDPAATNWTKATTLAPIAHRFETREWPTLSARTEPGSDWPTYRTHLFRAKQYGLTLPWSAHRIKALLDATTPHCSRNSGLDDSPNP